MVWKNGDFSDAETQVKYADPEVEIVFGTNNELTRISVEDNIDTDSHAKAPEMILFRHVTSGEFAREFKPTIFLEIVTTDLS